jgi:HSP20 family protein
MSNILIRKGQTVPAQEWDPMRWARDLVRWDPFREMGPSWPAEAAGFAPAFEIKENKEGFFFKADLPGIAEKDIEITRTGTRLTVSGRREAEKQEENETWYAYERSYGSFTRAFTLPDGADVEHVRADLRDGVLTVVVPKLPEAQPQKVIVQGAQKKS